MNKKNFAMLLILFLFFINLPILTGFTIEFGKEETVYDYSISNCEEYDIPDSPARALVDKDGNVQLYGSHYRTRKAIGPNLNEVVHRCDVIMESGHSPVPRNYDDNEWIISQYTIDGKNIYGLIHNEYHGWEHNNCNSNPDTTDRFNCWWTSINLAKSTNAGKNFSHLTLPSHNIANIMIDYSPDNKNGRMGVHQPSNIISKEGYYYAKVRIRTPGYPLIGSISDGGVCVMRTNNLDSPDSWKFWDGAGFNLLTKNLPLNGNCANTFRTEWDWHYSEYFGQYVTFGKNKNKPITVELSKNLDLTNIQITEFQSPFIKYTPYFTLIQPGAETRNFEDIDRSPWLYFTTCGEEVECGTDDFRTLNRDIKRIRVRFNKPEDIGKYDVLDLRFNEYKGTKTLDSSFYGNDGTILGNANFNQAGNQKFIHFDSGKITVSHAESLNLTEDISIKARIRTSQIPAEGNYPVIIAKKKNNLRNYALFLTPSGNIHFSITNGDKFAGSASNRKINDGIWHNITVTFSSLTGTANYIIDGKTDKVVQQGGKLSNGINNENLEIGSGFIGDIDRLTVYNYLFSLPISDDIAEDTNKDGIVNINDLNEIKKDFGKNGNFQNQRNDINKDSIVNIRDFVLVIKKIIN